MALLMTKAMLGKLAGESDLSWGGFFICLFLLLYWYLVFMVTSYLFLSQLPLIYQEK